MEGPYEEESCESAVSSDELYDSGKVPIDTSDLSLEAKRKLPPVQEFVSLPCAPPGEHS